MAGGSGSLRISRGELRSSLACLLKNTRLLPQANLSLAARRPLRRSDLEHHRIPVVAIILPTPALVSATGQLADARPKASTAHRNNHLGRLSRHYRPVNAVADE